MPSTQGGRQANSHDRAIDVRLSQLRKKPSYDHREKPLFSTVRGGGYMLDCSVEEANEKPDLGCRCCLIRNYLALCRS